MNATTAVLTIVTAAIFALGGIGALVAAPPMRETWAKLNISDSLGRMTGALEIAAASGLAISLFTARALGLAAATGLVLLMIGAIVHHICGDDAAGAAAPAVLGIVSAVTAVLIATNGL